MSREVLPARPSRRRLAAFVAVMLVLTGQLIWWMTYQVRSINENFAASCQLLDQQSRWAQRWLQHAPSTPEELLRREFPHLLWDAAAGRVVPAPARLAYLAQRRAQLIRMFVAESAFFWFMVALGATLIVRTLRQEAALLRQQQNFLSAVTHELKSPLAALRLQAQTLQLRDPPAEKRQHYLACMEADIGRLDGLVANLLAAARLDAGHFAHRQVHFDMVREVAHAADEVAAAWRQGRAGGDAAKLPSDLEMELPGEAFFVHCDPAVVRTVVRNLLSNAAKYGGAAPVMLRLRRRGHVAELSVTDHGTGLAADELPHIFQKFYRVGDEMQRQTEGSGLGLYLVETLLQQSGGQVTAYSPGIGHGSTFVATLPLASGA